MKRKKKRRRRHRLQSLGEKRCSGRRGEQCGPFTLGVLFGVWRLEEEGGKQPTSFFPFPPLSEVGVSGAVGRKKREGGQRKRNNIKKVCSVINSAKYSKEG